jgi:MarR family transcriptional regulator, organic hydroperoxide resistance regulator
MSTQSTTPATPSVVDERFLAAWEQFFTVVRRARGRAAQQHDGGLSLSQFLFVDALADGPLTSGGLAELAGVSTPTATRMLDGLERDGLVRREHDRTDRRCVVVTLTPEGRRALRTKRAAMTKSRARIAAQLTPAQREQATDILMRLAVAIEAEYQ